MGFSDMLGHLDSAVGDIAGGAVVGWIRGTGGQKVVDTWASHTCKGEGQVVCSFMQ